MLKALLLVFVSGASVMISELVAGRLVAPHFGQSIRTWTALTGVTLLGCTLGNMLGALGSRRSPRHVAGVAFLAGGVSVAMVPLTLPILAKLGLVPAITLAWLLPSVLLGCVTPAAAAAAVRPEKNGSDLSVLYALSMAGSLLGAALGGLLLPFVVPADVLYYVLGGILLTSAPVAFSLTRSAGRAAACATAEMKPPVEPLSNGALYAGVFFVGYLGMAAEMAASKLIVPILGGNHVVWALIIASFIGWMALGGSLGGRMADRFPHPVVTVLALGLAALGIAGTCVFETRVCTLPTMDALNLPIRLMLQIVVGLLPVAFLLGAANTVLLKFATARALGTGDRAAPGLFYALSSAGAVVGTFVTGLWCTGLVPGHVLMGILAVATAALAVYLAKSYPDSAKWGGVMLAAIFLTAALLVSIAARRTVPHDIAVSGEIQLASGESSYNVVNVTANPARATKRSIWLDRIWHTTVDAERPTDLSSSYTTMIDVMVGASNVPHRAIFMIGGGGYALPIKWSQDKDPPEKVVVAEIDPVVKDMAFRYLKPRDVTYPAGWEFPVGDGRAVVKTLERGSFDVVIGDTIADLAVPYHLVTAEFTAELKGLLKEGGVYLLHVLDVPKTQELATVLARTLHRSFRYVGGLYYNGLQERRQSIVLFATDDQKKFDLDAFARSLKAAVPESYPHTVVYPDETDGFCLTDRFSPVERWIWKTATSAKEAKVMRLARLASQALDHDDYNRAHELATRALDLDPDFSQALEVIYYWLCRHSNDADALARLRLAASHENPDDCARRLLARFLKEHPLN